MPVAGPGPVVSMLRNFIESQYLASHTGSGFTENSYRLTDAGCLRFTMEGLSARVISFLCLRRIATSRIIREISHKAKSVYAVLRF